MTTISEVINALKNITIACKQSGNKAGLFAALYLRMTEAVAEGIKSNFFEDGKRMERLDIAFAKRYIDAYNAYFNGNACQPAWKIAFDACKDDSLVVFQHLLLGINTHINLDLAISAADIAPGNNITGLQTDFNRINEIISSLADDIQECLCRLWWPMRMLTRIANGRQNDVLNFSIDKARNASWANANLLANLPTASRLQYIQQMDFATGSIAGKIANPGALKRILLRTIKSIEYANVAKTIEMIEETVIN